mmetsp:Transcript_1577/g.5148  ORF Transcript_1577/g.5148 Transcript_1577/m.5148 type:complete len:82 (+) Transcript_1577:2016-2261(+)
MGARRCQGGRLLIVTRSDRPPVSRGAGAGLDDAVGGTAVEGDYREHPLRVLMKAFATLLPLVHNDIELFDCWTGDEDANDP